jgi:hypothetical protein
LNKKFINSPIAMLSTIIVLLIVCSTQLVGTASSQQLQQAPSTGDTAVSPVIQGLEGLQGFKLGHNQLSLAIIPLSQQNNQMTFQVIGFAVSSPESGQAVVYSLKTPLPGIIDPSQNTMQIDIKNIDAAVNTAGYIDSSEVYDTIRTDPHVVVIDIDLTYQSKQGSQTIFTVNGVDIIPPDGKMQTFSMQQPTQLIIDRQNDRVAMVAFPEMINAFGNYYGVTYSQVEPVIYTEPIPILAPIFVPFIQPIPIFISGFIGFNPFFFGTGFRPFFDRDRITDRDRFSNRDRFPIRESRNDFADRSRNNLVAGQRRGEFTQSRKMGTGIKGGIGGFRGGVKASAGRRAGGGRRR